MKSEMRGAGTETIGKTFVGGAFFPGRQKASLRGASQALPAIPAVEQRADREEKEKKGAGAPIYLRWGSGAPVARIGTGLGARSGLFGSGRLAALLARLFGGEAGGLGSFFLSRCGAHAVLALAVLAGLAGLAAVCMLATGIRGDSAGGEVPLFRGEAPRSSMIPHQPNDRSLQYLSDANKGELGSPGQAEQAAQAPKAEEPGTQEQPPAAPEAAEPAKPDVSGLLAQAKAGLDRNGFLKGGLQGSDRWAAGGERLKDSLGAFHAKKTFSDLGLAGRLKPLPRPRDSRGVRSMSTLRGRAGRAMGQLKLAKDMSARGLRATYGDPARQYSTDAFEQGKSIGSSTLGIDPSGIVVPPGVTDPTPDPSPDPVPTPTPTPVPTPHDPDVSNAGNSGNNAAMLKMLGMMLLAIGAVMMLLGMKLIGNPFTAMIGAVLLALGLALIAAGIGCLAMSSSQADNAKNTGKHVSQQHGQDDQGDVIDDCASQAAEGTRIEDCRPAKDQAYFQRKLTNTIHDDVERERSSTYVLQ